MVNPVANALSKILNVEKKGEKSCLIHPTNKLIKEILKVLNEEGYLGTMEEITPLRGGVVKINLLGNINNCGAITPRFSVSLKEYEKFEKRYLPAKGAGVLVVSTPEGVMTQEKAKEKKLGGRLLAYCY